MPFKSNRENYQRFQFDADASSSEALVINEDEQDNASATVHAIPDEKCHNQQVAYPLPLKTAQVTKRERRKKLVDANQLQDTTRSDFDQVSQSLSISLKEKHPAGRYTPLNKQLKMTVFHRSKRSLLLNQNKGKVFEPELELPPKATEDSSFSDIKKSSLFIAQKSSHRTQRSTTTRTGYFILNVRPETEFFGSSKTTILISPKANLSQNSRTNLAEGSDTRYVESSDNELSESLEVQFLDMPKVNSAESLKTAFPESSKTTVSHTLEADFSESSASKYKKIVEATFSKSPRSNFSGNSRAGATKSPETKEVPITNTLNDKETYFPASLKVNIVREPKVNSTGIPGTNFAENSGTKYSSESTRANLPECSGAKTSGSLRTKNKTSRETTVTENAGTNSSKTTRLSGLENPRKHSRKSTGAPLSENVGVNFFKNSRTNYSNDPGTNLSEISKKISTDSKEANVSKSPATNFSTSSDSRLEVRSPKGLGNPRKSVSDSPKSRSSASSPATFYSASSTFSSPKNPGARDIPITESPKNQGTRDIPVQPPYSAYSRIKLVQGEHPGSSGGDLGKQAPSRSPPKNAGNSSKGSETYFSATSKQGHSRKKRSGLRLRTRALNVIKQGLSSVDSLGRNLYRRTAGTQWGEAALKRARSLGKNQYVQMGTSALSTVYGAVWSRVPSKETLASARNAALRGFMAATVHWTTVDRVRALLEWNYIRPYLERFLPPSKYAVPENMDDKYKGFILRMLMTQDNAPAILCLIKIIAKHVTIDKGSPPENPRYKMSYQCLLNTAYKLHKKGYLKPRKDISKMELIAYQKFAPKMFLPRAALHGPPDRFQRQSPSALFATPLPVPRRDARPSNAGTLRPTEAGHLDSVPVPARPPTPRHPPDHGLPFHAALIGCLNSTQPRPV
ncbi:unnamed protein product [Bemisia tabaci]|uniref:Uncharacterized protein n=1 Tax=Bemisia tabaci TaxID=7038 RepID=A0A9P0ANA6_BEMTA|nr:unnamed protein product [Bemisia tabaci]